MGSRRMPARDFAVPGDAELARGDVWEAADARLASILGPEAPQPPSPAKETIPYLGWPFPLSDFRTAEESHEKADSR